MANKVNKDKQKLVVSVRIFKKALSDAGIKNAKTLFLESMYGKVLYSSHVRLDNLWSCKSADKEFTDKLEKFTNKYV